MYIYVINTAVDCLKTKKKVQNESYGSSTPACDLQEMSKIDLILCKIEIFKMHKIIADCEFKYAY